MKINWQEAGNNPAWNIDDPVECRIFEAFPNDASSRDSAEQPNRKLLETLHIGGSVDLRFKKSSVRSPPAKMPKSARSSGGKKSRIQSRDVALVAVQLTNRVFLENNCIGSKVTEPACDGA